MGHFCIVDDCQNIERVIRGIGNGIKYSKMSIIKMIVLFWK